MDGDHEPVLTHEPLSIHFRLLYNWGQGIDQDPLLQHKVRMYAAFEVELNQVPIYRLIDAALTSSTSPTISPHQHYQYHHQHQHQHWVSAGQLWKACGLTMIEGLFLFELASSQYQLDFLQPSFPFIDIWVPLGMARSMATTLGVIDDLAWFLNESSLCKVASSDDPDRQEMVHNWQIVGIPNTSYSTRALLDYTLTAGDQLFTTTTMNNNDNDMNELAPPQQQQTTTTLMKRYQYQPGIVMKDRADTGLVRWQVWAYEHFLTRQQGHPSFLFDDGTTHDGDASGSDGHRRRQRHQRQHKQQRYSGTFIHTQSDDDDDDDNNDDNYDTPPIVPVTALWDTMQGLLCDLQSLERRQHQDTITTTTATPSSQQNDYKQLKASRVFSDSMVIGNMPLKSTFLRQSTALQHIYLSVMMEKLYNAMGELSMMMTTTKQKEHALATFSEPPTLEQQQQQQQKGPMMEAAAPTTSTSTSVSTTTQSERTTNTSKAALRHRSRSTFVSPPRRNNNQNHSITPTTTGQIDPNMMLHDRMDLLEQEMYRVKKRAKRKMDESDLKWMELQHQLMTLDTWKRNLESRRKNERAWMLLIILLLSLVLWVFL